jgi:hypothetical protein
LLLPSQNKRARHSLSHGQKAPIPKGRRFFYGAFSWIENWQVVSTSSLMDCRLIRKPDHAAREKKEKKE